MKTISLAAAIACSATSASPALADSTLALACLGCHQASVNAPEMPALNRLSVKAIAYALRRARDQPFPGSIMARFTAKMTDAEIDQLSAELGRAESR